MKNNIDLVGPAHPYQRKFQMALLNLARIASEERMRARLKSLQRKAKTND